MAELRNKSFQEFRSSACLRLFAAASKRLYRGVVRARKAGWHLQIEQRPLTMRRMSSPQVTRWSWLCRGDDMFPAMLAAINAARKSVLLETYIFAASPLGDDFRDALIQARRRGVGVRVLVDAFGSLNLPDQYWSPLREAGGEARFFNPMALKRFEIRNHRKLLVCDETVAFIGGFNIAPEYEGDGITRGWRDVGLQVEGPLAAQLAASAEELFALAEFRHKRFPRLRRGALRRTVAAPEVQLLMGGPGRGFNPIRRALQKDLRTARSAQIMVAYFLPTGRLHRALLRLARQGGGLQLVLAGKSDVALSQLAGRSLYRRLLKAGADVSEYAPQILHAKLLIVDDAVYVGSANLDPRSLGINYELMVRFQNSQMAAEARAIFAAALQHSRRIDSRTWRRSRSLFTRLKESWARFFLSRIDPYLANKQWRALPD